MSTPGPSQGEAELVHSANRITTLSVTLTAGLLVIYLTYSWYEWRRLSHIPGPFWASFTKLWMVYQSLMQRQPFAFKEAHEKFGSLIRVGPNEVATNDPEILRKIMAVRSTYTRGDFYKAMRFDPDRDNLLSQRDEVAHTQMRAKMAAGYSGKENISMEGTVDDEIANFVHLIESKYISTSQDFRPMQFGEKASFFTLDVISNLAFGQAFGYLSKDEDVYDYLKITEASISFLILLANVPILADILQSRVLRRLMPSEADKAGFGAFIGVAKRIVAERFKPKAESQFDMLGSFIRHGLTEEEAAGEALLQIAAGSDTSAGAIRTIMLHTITNPNTYKKLQAEIDEGIGTGKISSPVTDTEGRQLPYLQALIKEGLRYYPPASGNMFKQVPAGGDVIDDKFLPGGTQIGGSALGMHHSKQIYGPDADLFRPERWLEASAERAIVMNNAVDVCFHSGKYQCLGKSVALMEFNKVFVELFRRFDFSVCRADRPANVYNAGLWYMNDFWLRVTVRDDLPSI